MKKHCECVNSLRAITELIKKCVISKEELAIWANERRTIKEKVKEKKIAELFHRVPMTNKKVKNKSMRKTCGLVSVDV